MIYRRGDRLAGYGRRNVRKNIVIFSDGTGQRGGLLFDERRSSIYKLYRATRCGPDTSVNPAEQLTFYDPGIGTLPAGIGLIEITMLSPAIAGTHHSLKS
jgi:uncharacterized protein (DUF2235 family)